MFYKQTINNVELVVLCLDGGLLDLNRLRYNYFNRICKQYNHTVSKEVFAQSLGNSKTMYNQSPIQDAIRCEELNEIIEKDLFEYAKLKQNVKKDGVDELLQFFKQKKIKVAVISTHTTKRAVQYLQLAKIYQYVDFVIGGDSDCLPLPNASLLHNVCTKMNVATENAVVIANFASLVKAANELFMNIIYLHDLVPVDTEVSTSVYKVVKNNLEIINVFLFTKYDSAEIYSSVLGMSKDMDLASLEKTYQRLLIEYQDDLQLIALVKRTYRFFLMEINNTLVYEKKEKSLDALFLAKTEQQEAKNRELVNHFEDLHEKITNRILMQEEPPIDSIEDTNAIFKSVKVEENLYQEENFDQEVESSTFEPVLSDLPDSFKQEAATINNLIDEINKVSKMEEEKVETLVDATPGEEISKVETPLSSIEVEAVEKESPSVIDGVLDFVYVLIMSLVVSVVSLLGYMLVEDYLQHKSIISSAINSTIDFYLLCVNTLYTYIFDGIHAVISVIPNYNTLLKGNDFISTLAIQVILFTIINLIIYYIIKLIFTFINKGSASRDK